MHPPLIYPCHLSTPDPSPVFPLAGRLSVCLFPSETCLEIGGGKEGCGTPSNVVGRGPDSTWPWDTPSCPGHLVPGHKNLTVCHISPALTVP